LQVVDALAADELAEQEKHVRECAVCQDELERLRAVVDTFAGWPADVVRPAPLLWDRLAHRIASETATTPVLPLGRQTPPDADWEEVAPGISCKLLATDTERRRVTMLVRLAPKTAYPAHQHAGVEELHLLDGELWIEDRLLHPGDYNRAEPATGDTRVWSETGCTCVLITSPDDVLR
jgi:hypothetical protein